MISDLKGVSLLGTDAQGKVQGIDVRGDGMGWLADTQVIPLSSINALLQVLIIIQNKRPWLLFVIHPNFLYPYLSSP